MPNHETIQLLTLVLPSLAIVLSLAFSKREKKEKKRRKKENKGIAGMDLYALARFRL